MQFHYKINISILHIFVFRFTISCIMCEDTPETDDMIFSFCDTLFVTIVDWFEDSEDFSIANNSLCIASSNSLSKNGKNY